MALVVCAAFDARKTAFNSEVSSIQLCRMNKKVCFPCTVGKQPARPFLCRPILPTVIVIVGEIAWSCARRDYDYVLAEHEETDEGEPIVPGFSLLPPAAELQSSFVERKPPVVRLSHCKHFPVMSHGGDAGRSNTDICCTQLQIALSKQSTLNFRQDCWPHTTRQQFSSI